MRKITYTNALGSAIEIDYRPYLLQSLEISPLIDSAITTKGYAQDGETLQEAYAEPRDIVMTIGIFNANIDYAIFELETIFNPKLGSGTLTVQTDYHTKDIIVKLDASPKTQYDLVNYDDETGFASVMISMTAHNPYFIDTDWTIIDLVGLSGGFFWETPTYFYEETPFYLGELSSASKIFSNAGHIPAPLYIEWTGEAVNPKIVLENTGEFILLNKTLSSDERAIITTGYNDKNAYIETISTGVITRDNSIVDKTSTYFQLPLGDSTISLYADSGAENALARIKYKKRYSGV